MLLRLIAAGTKLPGWVNEGFAEYAGRFTSDYRLDLKEIPLGLTQLEISSTEVRKSIAAGRDPRYLMPDAVRAYIGQTGCYRPKR